MDSRHYKDLQEAYHQVYSLDEGVPETVVKVSNWVRRGPHRHQQAMAEREKKKMQKKIPYAALTAEEFDAILSYLLDEGYVDSVESAEVMVEAMSDEWLDEILDEGLMHNIKKGVKRALKPGPLPPLDTHIPVTAKPKDRDFALQKAMLASKTK